MTLRQRTRATGNVLFRWRSYLPLLMVVGASLLLGPRASDGAGAHAWRILGCTLVVLGLLARVMTVGSVSKGTSGRNTKRQKASRLNRSGTYSIVRNPLYLGNVLVWAGVVAVLQDLPLLAIVAALLLTYYAFVAFAEKEYLAERFGQEYVRYARVTPWIVPDLRLWRAPELGMSWRMVLRREHDTVLSAITGLVAAVHYVYLWSHREFLVRREWACLWFAVLLAWLAVKVLKKRTRVLHDRSTDSPAGQGLPPSAVEAPILMAGQGRRP